MSTKILVLSLLTSLLSYVSAVPRTGSRFEGDIDGDRFVPRATGSRFEGDNEVDVVPRAAKLAVNKTLDDTDLLLLPTNQWQSSSKCSDCGDIVPNAADCYDQTWSSATRLRGQDPVNATFSFHGRAVYLYFVAANYPSSSGISDSVVDITIDNDHVFTYTHKSSGDSSFQYNVLAYSNTSLDHNTTHTVTMSVAEQSLFIFDYAVFTTVVQDSSAEVNPDTTASSADSSTSATTTSSTIFTRPLSKGALAGIIVGSTVPFLLILALTIFLVRRSRLRQADRKTLSWLENGLVDVRNGNGITPFVVGLPPPVAAPVVRKDRVAGRPSLEDIREEEEEEQKEGPPAYTEGSR